MKGLCFGLSEKIFKDFSMKNLLALECGHFWPGGHNLNKLGKGPLGYASYQIFTVSEKSKHFVPGELMKAITEGD